jgi:hypothetical protein
MNEDTYEGDITNPLSLNQYTYVHNNPLIYSDPTGNWCEATVNDVYYAHPGGCNDGGEEERFSGPGYTIDEIHNGHYYYDEDRNIQQYFTPGAPHISDPTGISQAIIGCAYDSQCGGFVTGGIASSGTAVVDGTKAAGRAIGTGARAAWNWGKDLIKGKPEEPIGKPFNPNGPAVQEGVDPRTLTPQKDLGTLSRQRMNDAVTHAKDKPIKVDRNGVVQDGHHRLKDAIENNRAVDVQIGY